MRKRHNVLFVYRDYSLKPFLRTAVSSLIFVMEQNLPKTPEVFPYLSPDRQVKVDVPASERSSNPIEQWLEAALGSSANVAQLASTIEDDDDPRIRPMSKDELSSLEQYFENESEILLTKRILQVIRYFCSRCVSRCSIA